MASIFIKDYNTEVEFPDGMPQQEIEAALRSQFPPKVKDRSFLEKAASLVTLGHVGGESGPEAEVKFSPSGMMKQDEMLYPYKDDRSLLEKTASLLTMGHVGGEAGPEAEVKFNPRGQDYRQRVESGSDWANDPITAIAMGGGGGLASGMAAKAGGATMKQALGTGLKYAGREATAWGTAGLSEAPGLVKAAGKGISNMAAKSAAERNFKAAGHVPAPAAPVRAAREPLAAEVAPGQNMPTFPIKGEAPAPGFVDQFMEAPVASPLDAVIPEVRGGMAGELPKYAEGSSINLERLNGTEDLKQFINAKTADIESAIGKRVISQDETRAMAESLGWNADDAVKAWKKKGSMTAAEMDATRQLNMNSIENLHKAIKELPPGQTTLTPELRAQFLDAMDLVKTTSQASSEAGRALNIHKRILANDPAFAQTSMMNKAMKAIEGKGAGRTDDIINAMKDVDFADPVAVNKFIYGVTRNPREKLSDGAYELYLNGLLSNPLTHIVNTTSNALTGLYTIPERLLGAGIESVSAKIAGRQKEIFAGEALQDVFAIKKGLQDGITRFGTALTKGDAGGKLENFKGI